jgi:HSP20 family protein
MSRTLATFDPAREIAEMSSWMDRFFDLPSLRDFPTARFSANLTLPVDIYEKEGNLVIKAAVPGVSEEDLDISIQDNVLTIRGETREEDVSENGRVYRREYNYGTFTRSLRLPNNIHVDQPEADFDKGFVTISFPIREEDKPESLKVPIKSKAK